MSDYKILKIRLCCAWAILLVDKKLPPQAHLIPLSLSLTLSTLPPTVFTPLALSVIRHARPTVDYLS